MTFRCTLETNIEEIANFKFNKNIRTYITGLESSKPRREKTGIRGFRPGPTLTGLYSHKIKREA